MENGNGDGLDPDVAADETKVLGPNELDAGSLPGRDRIARVRLSSLPEDVRISDAALRSIRKSEAVLNNDLGLDVEVGSRLFSW